MARRSALEIVLSEKDRRDLETWQRSTTIRAGVAKRGWVVLLRAEGAPLSRIAERVGMCRRHVEKWVRRFCDGRIDALSNRKGGGRKPAFSPRSICACRQDRLRAS